MNSNSNSQRNVRDGFRSLLERRNLILGIILLVALVGFEMFNYSTTQFALNDLLGDLTFAGVSWATILALAFCGIDFAGVFRLFSTNDEEASTKEVWYLFGAWLLAATLNATLTWWGVSIALVNHTMTSTSVVDQGLVVKIVPIFVAIVVWVTRILLISSISSAGSRFLSAGEGSVSAVRRETSVPAYERPLHASRPVQPAVPQAAQYQEQPSPRQAPTSLPSNLRPVAPAPASEPNRNGTRPRPISRPPEPEPPEEPEYIPDPTYIPTPSFHSLSAKGGNGNGNKSTRQ